MSKTLRENYRELLDQLGITEDELRISAKKMLIIFEGGSSWPVGKADLPIVAFIVCLRVGRPATFVLTSDDRVALMAYATNGIADDARCCPATRHAALRALLQPGARVQVTGHSALA